MGGNQGLQRYYQVRYLTLKTPRVTKHKLRVQTPALTLLPGNR